MIYFVIFCSKESIFVNWYLNIVLIYKLEIIMGMKGKIECDNCSSIVCPLCGGGIEVRLFNERTKILTCSNRKVILIKGAFRIYLII